MDEDSSADPDFEASTGSVSESEYSDSDTDAEEDTQTLGGSRWESDDETSEVITDESQIDATIANAARWLTSDARECKERREMIRELAEQADELIFKEEDAMCVGTVLDAEDVVSFGEASDEEFEKVVKGRRAVLERVFHNVVHIGIEEKEAWRKLKASLTLDSFPALLGYLRTGFVVRFEGEPLSEILQGEEMKAVEEALLAKTIEWAVEDRVSKGGKSFPPRSVVEKVTCVAVMDPETNKTKAGKAMPAFPDDGIASVWGTRTVSKRVLDVRVPNLKVAPEVEVVELSKTPGDAVKKGDLIARIKVGERTRDVFTRREGIISYGKDVDGEDLKKGSKLPGGKTLARIREEKKDESEDASEDAMIVSLMGTTLEDCTRWEKEADGWSGCPLARAMIDTPEQFKAVDQKSAFTPSHTFMVNEDNAITEKIASPFPALFVRLVIGLGAKPLKLPPEKSKGGVWTDARVKRINALRVALKKTLLAPPAESVIATLRALPSWLGGVPASDSFFPESVFEKAEFEKVSRRSRRSNSKITSVPEEGDGLKSTLRDRTLMYLFLGDLAYSDAALRMGSNPSPVGTDKFIFATFDSLRILPQLVSIFVVSIVVEETATRMIEKNRELAHGMNALSVIAYARHARSWARDVLQNPSGYASSEKRHTPRRRRILMLTLLFLVPVKARALINWKHASVPRCLRLAQGALRAFGRSDDLALLSENGFQRFENCSRMFQSEMSKGSIISIGEPDLMAPPAAAVTAEERRPSVCWLISVRASDASSLLRPRGASGQFVTAMWNIREQMNQLRRYKPGESFVPGEIVLSISCGSKIFPRRIDRLLILLDKRGELFESIVAFATEFDTDGSGNSTSSYPLPQKLSKELKEDMMKAFVSEIFRAVLPVTIPVTSDSSAEGSPSVDYYGDPCRCAFIHRGGDKEDTSLEHLDGFGERIVLKTIMRLLCGEGNEREDKIIVSAITGSHDRRLPGSIDEETAVSGIRYGSVLCLATSAILAKRPDLICPMTGFLVAPPLTFGAEPWKVAVRNAIERISLLGVVCTSQFSTTLSSGELCYNSLDAPGEVLWRRLETYAAILTKLAQKIFGDLPQATAEKQQATAEKQQATAEKQQAHTPAGRDALFLLRRSNPEADIDTQLVRTRRLLRRRVQSGRVRYSRAQLLLLCGFKGTHPVPVGADPRVDRRVRVHASLRLNARGDDLSYTHPRANSFASRVDLGEFVKPMIDALRGEGLDGGKTANLCDIFIAAHSRICMPGAIKALKELDEHGHRVFCWDLWEVGIVNVGLRRWLLRDDWSLRLNDENVCQFLEACIAMPDRFWRIWYPWAMGMWD